MKTHQLKFAGLELTLFDSVEEAGRVLCPDASFYRGALIALNAEKLVKLKYNNHLFSELVNPLFYADGAGALMVVRGKNSRVPGVELWLEILNRVQDRNFKICVLGAAHEVNHTAVEMLKIRYPNLAIAGRNGFLSDIDYIGFVKAQAPDIIFVAMGSPLQEKLIAKLQQIKQDALYMGIGGSLDVFVGNVKRAPKIFRKLNLEFLYRLIIQPTRIFRHVNLVKFVFFYAFGRMK